MAEKDKFEQWLDQLTETYANLNDSCPSETVKDNCETCLGLLELVKDAYRRREKL